MHACIADTTEYNKKQPDSGDLVCVDLRQTSNCSLAWKMDVLKINDDDDDDDVDHNIISVSETSIA